MEEELHKIMEVIKERLSNSRKYDWTGGYNAKFFLDFIHSTIQEAVKETEQRIIKEFIEKLMVETSPGKPLSVIECIDSMRSKYQVND